MRDRPKFQIDRGEPLSASGRPRASARPGAPPASARAAAAAGPAAPDDGIVRVSRQTKGRKGKGVTLVTGLRLTTAELEALCKRLKQRCGAGGTVRERTIEIQGDQRDLLVAELEAAGHAVKRAGG